MTSRRSNPAIFAGLAGAAAWGAPTCAQALTVMGYEVPTSDPGFTFVAGCVTGAIVAGCGSLAILRAVAARTARAEIESALRGSHAQPAVPSRTAAQAVPTQRSATAQAWEQTGDIRVQVPAAKVPGAQAAGAPEPVRDAIEDAWSAWEANAKASTDYVDVAEGYVRTRTLAERMSARAKGVASVLSERLGASRMEGLPVIERADGSVGDVGESWWDDAMSASSRPRATSPLGGESVEEGMSGNSAVLFTAQTAAEAQAARAVWQQGAQQAASASAASRPASAAQAPQDAQPSPASAQVAYAQPAPTAPTAQAAAPSRESLAERLANPAEAFPEKKPKYTDEQRDMWAEALAALDERYEEQVVMEAAAVPQVVVTTPVGDELDEPEGLEPNTAFIPFKPQAGHPEVVDTESYVDMLVDQELARNESPSVRRLARHKLRDYFKVIDGTGDIKSARHLAAQQA